MLPTKSLMCSIFFFVMLGCDTQHGHYEPKVLVITSNPERFNSNSFFNMVFSIPGFAIDTISQPKANKALLSDSIQNYQAILFYDMWQDISEQQKEAFIQLTEEGTGLVFLHHALVSYQEWEMFPQIIKGKYFHDRFEYPQERYSTYKHDIELEIIIVDSLHPVTYNLKNFHIVDEGYHNIWMDKNVVPLLKTDHPDCTSTIGWTHQFNQSKVVYILPGHGPDVFNHPKYQALIFNALTYVLKQSE